MDFYAPMFLVTGILMLAAMSLAVAPEVRWWAERRRAALHRRDED